MRLWEAPDWQANATSHGDVHICALIITDVLGVSSISWPPKTNVVQRMQQWSKHLHSQTNEDKLVDIVSYNTVTCLANA